MLITRSKFLKIEKALILSNLSNNSIMTDVLNSNIEEVASQPMMKIQSTNYQVESNVPLYPEELKMLIVVLKRSVLATAIFNSFVVPISWLSMDTSTATYNKATYIITFNLVNDKHMCLTKKMFSHFLELPNSPPFFKPTNP